MDPVLSMLVGLFASQILGLAWFVVQGSRAGQGRVWIGGVGLMPGERASGCHGRYLRIETRIEG